MQKIFAIAAVVALATGCGPAPAPVGSPGAAPAPTTAKTAPAVTFKVVNMSPRSTHAATPFNVQRDHGSGISFEINHPVPAGEVLVMFDGKPLGGVAANGVIVTATIPDAYIAKPGHFAVTVQVPGSTPLPAGEFIVD